MTRGRTPHSLATNHYAGLTVHTVDTEEPIMHEWLRTRWELFWLEIPGTRGEGLNEDDLLSLEKALEDWFKSQRIRLV